jgi:DNA invertase Pin-like site-specific DNA recombinase
LRSASHSCAAAPWHFGQNSRRKSAERTSAVTMKRGTRGATGRLILNVFAAFAQFEREMMLERQREGIARAKAEGKYKGRKPTARVKATDAIRLFREGKRVSDIAKELCVARASVYRALDAVGLRSL